MKIDVQCHVFPRAYAELFAKHSQYPQTIRLEDKYLFDFNGWQKLAMPDRDYDPKTILASMDRAGIDMAVVSCNIPDPGLLPPEYAAEAARIANDEVAQIVSRRPDRFAGIAFLPWNVPEEAAKELERVAALGFKSVMLFSHNGGVHADDPTLLPLYARLEALDMPVTIHPSIPLWSESVGAYGMVAGVSFVIDTGFAVIRLVRSGILDKYPGLKLVMPHAGGVLPYLDGRLSYTPPGERCGPAASSRMGVPEHLKKGKIWLDLANPSRDVLSWCRGYVTADRLMLGSDYPFVEQAYITELVTSVFPKEEQEKVFWRNANAVYKLGL